MKYLVDAAALETVDVYKLPESIQDRSAAGPVQESQRLDTVVVQPRQRSTGAKNAKVRGSNVEVV